LYDTAVRTLLASAALTLALCASLGFAATPSPAADRLDRFRELALSRLARAQQGGGDAADAGMVEIYALVDEEIVESLDAGGPYASTAFIQERLDAFAAVWGAGAFRILRVPAAGRGPSLTIGLFNLTNIAPSGSVRLYGPVAGRAGLVRTATHDGAPEVTEWVPARDGAAQAMVSWLGPASARGRRPLRLELWRQRGDADAVPVWASEAAFPDGLLVSDFAVRRGEVQLRYELRYAGWKPGCDGQTEHEDVYRWAPATETLALARRQVVNAWHRELQGAVERFFAALAGGDRNRLTGLVPDARLRARLPAGLRPEPACEAQNPDTPGTVVVAATDEQPAPSDSSRVAALRRAPWSLWWSRAPSGWRLAGAAPVLQ